jgi:patatin-like phospholipase/acyl hydrolase
MQPTKLILAIDGGGTRGIIPATILALLEEKMGKPCNQIFDLIAGTSTGGIIALAIAAGVKCKVVQELYLENAEEIFYDDFWDNLRDGFGKNLGADYKQDKLKKILQGIVGNMTMGDVHTTSKNAPKPFTVMVPTFDLSAEKDPNKIDRNYRPKVFTSLHPHDFTSRLVDIACATSAGPTYFPIFKSADKNLPGSYIDGGVAINHPAMAALALAVNEENGLGWPVGQCRILSLGTGTSNTNWFDRNKIGDGDWGNLQWVKYLPDLLIESNMQASEYYVRQMIPDCDNNYRRIQHDLSNLPGAKGKTIGLDTVKWEVLKSMQQKAAAYFNDAASQQELLDFVQMKAMFPIIV